jgi:hypothetical protein
MRCGYGALCLRKNGVAYYLTATYSSLYFAGMLLAIRVLYFVRACKAALQK